MKLIKAVESGQLCLRRGVLDNLFVPGMSKDSLKSCSDNAEKRNKPSTKNVQELQHVCAICVCLSFYMLKIFERILKQTVSLCAAELPGVGSQPALGFPSLNLSFTNLDVKPLLGQQELLYLIITHQAIEWLECLQVSL